jgi:hypothetical protein
MDRATQPKEDTMSTERLRILDIKRLPSSVNGNPAWKVTFAGASDEYPLTTRTSSDASVSYAIGNPGMRPGCVVDVEFTRAGRIATMEPAPMHEVEEEADQVRVGEVNDEGLTYQGNDEWRREDAPSGTVYTATEYSTWADFPEAEADEPLGVYTSEDGAWTVCAEHAAFLLDEREEDGQYSLDEAIESLEVDGFNWVIRSWELDVIGTGWVIPD